MGKNKFIGQIREFNRYKQDIVKEAVTLDLIDRKIMYLLSQNARLSHTAIAKRLHSKRETVAYRIKRLEDQEFLHGYLTLIDHRKIGFKNYIVYLKLKTLLNEQELQNYLFVIPQITRLKNCSGTYDLQIIFTVKQEEEFVELFETIINKYYSIILNYEVMDMLEEDFLGLHLLLPKEETKGLHALEHKGSTFQKEFDLVSHVFDPISLDEKDQQILNILKLEANSSIKKISEQVSLAPIAVENRIKKMIQTGVIKKFIPLASLSHLGYQWWKVFFKFKNLDKQKFFTFLKYHSNVLWYMKLLGKWDYQFSVFAKDNAEFHKILDEIRSEFSDNIINYDSLIIFNQFKYVQRVE